MVDLNYAVLGYDNLYKGIDDRGNYGDEIQSIAAARCLPRVDTIINRSELNQFLNPTRHVLLMNGYFGRAREGPPSFPPSNDIVPIYFSFHIAGTEYSKAFYASPACLEHFKKWEPIGCRDRSTAELLAKKGIKTFFSKCLTLTFDKRPAPPHKSRLLIVDGDSLPIPEYLMNENVVQRVTHRWKGPYPGHQASMKSAQHLLDLYKHEANGVITSRLHCALPCLAMGVPIIFIPNVPYHDYGRVELYADIGGRVPPNRCPTISSRVFNFFPRLFRKAALKGVTVLDFYLRKLYMCNFHWQFYSREFENEKEQIRLSLRKQIDRQLAKL